MATREHADQLDDGLQALLDHLKTTRGFDFSGYKRTSLERRLQKRMAAVGVADYRDYVDYLEVNPSEFTDLFNTILINVTGFFRDREAWEYVAEQIVPQLLESTPPDRPLRVWSAACASGEEAYTAAIVLAEAIGVDRFRERVKIYATDVDEDALAIARIGSYRADALEKVPPELVERYFEESATGRVFRSDLRRSVIFGRNDLVQDAPISRIDLLISRNALMYFTAETQTRILAHFNFALNETGFLFVGKSEMLITHADLFDPHDLRWRVFRKVPQHNLRDRLALLGTAGASMELGQAERFGDLRTGALDVSPVAQVVVDRGGLVTMINHSAQAMFGIGSSDVGRPLQDLELSYRPVDVRTALQRASTERRTVPVGRVNWQLPGGEPLTLEVEVSPLFGASGILLGSSIHFEDVTEFAQLDQRHALQKRQLETAYEELQSTVEELETTNEELQSTNEELETTNEELQSTNEELETMNEELQSTNDQLEAMNDEQRERGSELDRLNLFLEGILGSLAVGVVVLDAQQRVQLWNVSARDLWGLRPDEVEGEYFLNLELGLPVHELRDAIRRALGDPPEASETVVDAIDRRGRAITCHVRTLPLAAPDGSLYGAILLMQA